MATWIFHRGALGDSVLTWPMMRAMRERGDGVTFVADGEKARLAARMLRVEGLDAEQRRFADLWVPGAGSAPVEGVELVVSFVADDRTGPGRLWIENARAMFSGAAIEYVPGPIDRVMALALAGDGGKVPARENPEGPLVLHVGAGSKAKRWPVERWGRLAHKLAPSGSVVVIAGEAEAERLNEKERAALAAIGGRFVRSLDELADTIGTARLFVGCDTGPTHLAGQLGVPTVALFGPTDPERWGPIGPRVHVVAPPVPSPMTWLDAGQCRAAIASARAAGQGE